MNWSDVSILNSLTPLQRAVLVCLVAGDYNEEIAIKVGTSHSSVTNVISRLMDKIGARTRVELAVWVVRRPEFESGINQIYEARGRNDNRQVRRKQGLVPLLTNGGDKAARARGIRLRRREYSGQRP